MRTVLRILLNVVVSLVVLLLVAFVGVFIWAQFSPQPGVFAINAAFRLGAVGTAETDDVNAPAVPVTGKTDITYGDGPREQLDVWKPAGATTTLPVIVWVHGGGWIGGDKSAVAPYLRNLAGSGFVVVGINYALAPAHRYPVPVRQTGDALSWLVAHAAEIGADPGRIVLAGDSAGAQIAAQYAALVSDSGYAAKLGIAPAITRGQLRATLLHCGPYDPQMLLDATGISGWFVKTIGWAYLGTKDFSSPQVREASVVTHATAAYPPSLLTGGDDDPLTPQGRALAARLTELAVPVHALWFPGLNHEFQFDLSLPQSQQVLADTKSFLAQHAGVPAS